MKTWRIAIQNIFQVRSEQSMPQDHTVYSIKTNIDTYCGRIIYQDDVCLRLRCSKSKPVKILKANITHIAPASSKTVEQYQRWLTDIGAITL